MSSSTTEVKEQTDDTKSTQTQTISPELARNLMKKEYGDMRRVWWRKIFSFHITKDPLKHPYLRHRLKLYCRLFRDCFWGRSFWSIPIREDGMHTSLKKLKQDPMFDNEKHTVVIEFPHYVNMNLNEYIDKITNDSKYSALNFKALLTSVYTDVIHRSEKNDTLPSRIICARFLPENSPQIASPKPTSKNFEDLNLNEDLLISIYRYGYESTSLVQQCAIVPIIQGKDVVCQSLPGTGKTSAYLISILQLINVGNNSKMTTTQTETKQTHSTENRLNSSSPPAKIIEKATLQAIVLVRARELSFAIHNVLRHLGECYGTKLKSRVFVGGTAIRDDIHTLTREGVHIAIGTPGRILDMIIRGAMSLDDVKILCFDQMDDLVEVGHNNPIREIYKRLPSPSKVQKCIFGHSKYYLQIEQLELMKMLFPSSKPHNEIIFLPKPPLRMMNATHYKISVDREEYKRDRLFGVLEQLSIKRAIIYCNSRRKMDWLEHEMTERNINVEIKQLNYRMQSEEVNNVIEEFRRGTEGILICSDSVTSRWRDPNDCQLVINYDLPHHFLSYCTRLGCSEIVHPYRHIAITFTLGNDIRENYCLKEIEKEFNIEFDELTSQVKSVV